MRIKSAWWLLETLTIFLYKFLNETTLNNVKIWFRNVKNTYFYCQKLWQDNNNFSWIKHLMTIGDICLMNKYAEKVSCVKKIIQVVNMSYAILESVSQRDIRPLDKDTLFNFKTFINSLLLKTSIWYNQIPIFRVMRAR